MSVVGRPPPDGLLAGSRWNAGEDVIHTSFNPVREGRWHAGLNAHGPWSIALEHLRAGI